MLMNLFGGMSKGERARVQIRVKAAMNDLAERTDRYLGGRPPTGTVWRTPVRTRTWRRRWPASASTASSQTR
jgi:hypothetical protein